MCIRDSLAAEAPSDNKALVDVVFTAHPSGLKFPTEIEAIRKPFSVAIGDKDPFSAKINEFKKKMIGLNKLFLMQQANLPMNGTIKIFRNRRLK